MISKAIIKSIDGKLRYSEQWAFYTKTKKGIALLPNQKTVENFCIYFGITEKDVIDEK